MTARVANNRELIFECADCESSKLATNPEWQHEAMSMWCSCGSLMAAVAFSKDLMEYKQERVR